MIVEEFMVIFEFVYVVVIFGVFDIFVEVVCESDEYLFDFIVICICIIFGVVYIESMFYVGFYKDFYNWGMC